MSQIASHSPQWTRARLARRSRVKMLYIEPGFPWKNGYVEILNAKLRDELVGRDVFDTLFEAKGAHRALA